MGGYEYPCHLHLIITEDHPTGFVRLPLAMYMVRSYNQRFSASRRHCLSLLTVGVEAEVVVPIPSSVSSEIIPAERSSGIELSRSFE